MTEPPAKLAKCFLSPFKGGTLPLVDTAVRETRLIRVNSNRNPPFTINGGDTKLSFVYTASNNCYLSNEVFVSMRLRIKHADGSDLKASENACLCSNPINSMFNKVVMSINDRECYTSTNYGLLSYITTAAFLPSEAQLRGDDTALWYLESGDPDSFEEPAKLDKCANYEESSVVDLYDKLRLYPLAADTYFPFQTKLQFDLYTYSPRQLVQIDSGIDVVIEITHLELHVLSFECRDQFLQRQLTSFNEGDESVFHFLEPELYMLNLRQGIREASTPQYSLSAYPRRVLVAFLPEINYTGDLLRSMFNFKSCGIQEYNVRINSTEWNMRLNPIAEDDSMFLYWLYRGLGFTETTAAGSRIQRGGTNRKWPNTLKCFYVLALDTSPNHMADCENVLSATPAGSVLTVNVTFAQPLPEATLMLVIPQIDKILTVAPGKPASLMPAPTSTVEQF